MAGGLSAARLVFVTAAMPREGEAPAGMLAEAHERGVSPPVGRTLEGQVTARMVRDGKEGSP